MKWFYDKFETPSFFKIEFFKKIEIIHTHSRKVQTLIVTHTSGEEPFEMVRHKSIHSICGHLSRQEQGALDNIGFLENFLEDLKNEKAPQKDINKFLDIFGIQDCLVKVVESEFSKKIHGIHKNVFIIKHKDTVDDNLVVEMDIQKVGFAGWVSIPM